MYNGYNFNPNYQNYQLPTYQYGQLNQLQAPQQQVTYLNGKIVDSVDVVKAMDVPIGGYGVYPKADLGEIYVKSWNPNGTTTILTYKVETEKSVDAAPSTAEEKIIARIDALESTLASLVSPQPAPAKKKEEININGVF
jgi:hypothetical protein